jgi:sec-independent protein translocase protein TatA
LPELAVIGGVVAILFGPAKLPELGRSLGKTVKSFQTAAKARANDARPPARQLTHPGGGGAGARLCGVLTRCAGQEFETELKVASKDGAAGSAAAVPPAEAASKEASKSE